MKKLYYTIPFLTIILSLWACDVLDDIDNRDIGEGNGINSYFPFEFYVSHPETMYWKSFSDMKLEIDNDHQVDDWKFHVSYSLNGKEGKMYMGDEEKYEFDLDKGVCDVKYKPMDKGTYVMTFTASNGKEEYDVEQVVEFEVINRPFKASVTADRYTFYQSENEPIHVLVTIDEADWVKYQYSYTTEQDNQITTTDGTIVEENKKYNLIENNTVELLFDPLGNNGTHTFFVHFYDTQGQEIVEEITFDVKSIDIGLTLDYTSELDKEVYYTEKSNLKFGLNPVFEDPNKVNYTAKAFIQDATGVIEIGSNRYKNGETFDIEVGNLAIGFIPTVEDYKNTNAKVGLLITDNYGNSEEISLPIKVNIIDFDFELTNNGSTDEIFFNELADLHFDFKNDYNVAHPDSPIYTVTYSVTGGEGTIHFNGVDYTSGSQFNITSPLDIDFSYKPTSYKTKINTIEFKIEDQYGTVHQESYDIKIKELGYKFSAVISGEDLLYLGDGEKKGKIACSIIPDENNTAGIEYFVTPNTDADGKFYYGGKEYGNNEKIKVTTGEFYIEYKPNNYNDGGHRIILTSSDTTKQEYKQNIDFRIYQKPEVEPESVRTWYYKDNRHGCFNGCDYDHHYMVKFNPVIDGSSTLYEVKIIIGDNNETYQKKYSDMSEKDGFKEFYLLTDKEPSGAPNYNNKSFNLYLIDAKGVENLVYTGVFTNNKNDDQ